MTIVGVIGLLLSSLGFPLAFRAATVGRVGVLLLLVLFHIAAAVAYYFFSLSDPADAWGYYFNYRIWMHLPWLATGTTFTAHLVAAMRVNLGATFLDCFLVFQAVGLLGILYLFRTFLEIHEKTRAQWALLPMYMLFMPTMHFWTAAIGKDAPLFLGIALAVWSALDFRRRSIGLFMALLIMVVFRPHIALATVLALGIATILQSQFSVGRKMFLLVLAVIAFVFFAGSVRSGLNIDPTSLSSLSEFLSERGAIEASDKAGSSIGNAPYVVKLLSLMFRPLFFDARNLFGMLVSLENIGSLLLFGFLIKNFRQVRILAKRVFFVRFVLVYAVILILLLAIANYNIGLGLRQRLMAIPPLFALFVSMWVLKGSPQVSQPQVAARFAITKPPATPAHL